MYVVVPMMGLPKSGGVRVLVELANGLAKRGHRVELVVARSSEEPGFPIDERVSLRQRSGTGSIPGGLWWLVRSIPREADAVIANFYLTAYPTALATYLHGQRGYYFVQGYEPGFFAPDAGRTSAVLQRALAEFSYRLPLRQIAVSLWLKGVLCEITGREVTVINDGVNTDLFSPMQPARAGQGGRTVLALGRKDPQKGMADLLEAMRILDRQLPGVRLLIATQSSEPVAAAPVAMEIVHPGDDRELARLYRQADVFAFPSRQEGFGLPPLEAMACGTPVVTTDCGGVSDYARDGLNCLVVPVGNPARMAAAIYRLLVEERLAERLAKAGRETACQFTWDAMVDRFERLLVTDVCGTREE